MQIVGIISGLSEPGPRLCQISIVLSQPGIISYAHHITTDPPPRSSQSPVFRQWSYSQVSGISSLYIHYTYQFQIKTDALLYLLRITVHQSLFQRVYKRLTCYFFHRVQRCVHLHAAPLELPHLNSLAESSNENSHKSLQLSLVKDSYRDGRNTPH